MQPIRPSRTVSIFSFLFAILLCGSPSVSVLAQTGGPTQIGPGNVVDQSKCGGQIFGCDIDQNGTEGVLTEAQTLPDGSTLAAVETFDQATGKILKVVKKITSKDDFVTWGVVDTSIGLVEREHVRDIFVVKRIYNLLNPLGSNIFTGTWTPPLTKDDILLGVSRLQGTMTTAVLGF